jgi:hypothetical protein
MIRSWKRKAFFLSTKKPPETEKEEVVSERHVAAQNTVTHNIEKLRELK